MKTALLLHIFIFFLSSNTIAQDKSQPESATNQYKSSGLMAITSFGILVNNSARLSASVIIGSQINERQSIGLGIGTDGYEGLSAMPVFIDLRVYFLRGDVKPFFFAQPGYGLAWREHSDGNVGGITLKTGAGVKMFIGSDFAFYFDAAFKYQAASIIDNSIAFNGYYYSQIASESSTNYKSFILEIGLAF